MNNTSDCPKCEKCVVDAWEKLNYNNTLSENRYRIWRTIATISLSVNGFIIGLLFGLAIFR